MVMTQQAKQSRTKKKPEPKKADAGGDGGAGDGDLQLVKENLPRAGEEEGDILKDAAINEEEEWEERQTATRRAERYHTALVRSRRTLVACV